MCTFIFVINSKKVPCENFLLKNLPFLVPREDTPNFFLTFLIEGKNYRKNLPLIG